MKPMKETKEKVLKMCAGYLAVPDTTIPYWLSNQSGYYQVNLDSNILRSSL